MSSMTGATGANPSLKGTGYQQISALSPQKAALFGQGAEGLQQGFPQILQQLMQLAGGGNEDFWKQLEAPAMRQFGELQGNIASRFSGAGTGARRSSGFQNAISSAGTDLAERLQSGRIGLQQGAQDRLMDFYNRLMGVEDTAFIPKQKKWWEELLPALAGGVGSGASSIGGIAALKKLGLF